MTLNVPKRAGHAGGRRTTETRFRLVAFLCTLVSFVVLGIFLFLDTQKVEQRDAMLASSGEPASTRGDAAPPGAAGQRPELSQPPRLAGTASQRLNDVLKAASSGDWARVDRLLTDTSASAGSGGKAPTSELTEQGRKAIAAGDYRKAIETLGAATAADPQDADALNYLAFALLREGLIESAYAHVTRSLALAPAHAAAWANAAEILAERDNALASQAALRVAIHLARDRDRTRRFLTQADQTVSSAKFRAVIAEVLPQFDDIPKAGRGAS